MAQKIPLFWLKWEFTPYFIHWSKTVIFHEKLEQNDLTTQEYYKKTRNFTRNRELPRNLYSLNPASFLAIESVFNSLITEVMFFTTTDSSLLRWLYFIIGLCVTPASSSTVVSSVVLHMRQGLVVLFLAACFYKILYIYI